MYLNGGTHSFNIILSETPISLLLAILCFLLAIPVGSLTGYHIFLTMRGVTTHEQVCIYLYIDIHKKNKEKRKREMKLKIYIHIYI